MGATMRAAGHRRMAVREHDRRLMSIVAARRFPFRDLITHR